MKSKLCLNSVLIASMLVCAIALSVGHAAGAKDGAAEAIADKMLAAIGGRDTWAGLKNTINGSQQNRAGEPTVVYAVITMDFEKPRFRIETTAQDLHLIRVINDDGHWRLRGTGKIEDVPAKLVEEDMQWYESHLYRTIHRIAARDPALSLAVNDKNRLEVYANGKRIKWFQLDADGEPYAFGAYDDEVGSLSGPWDFVQDGIHHPLWVSSSDGTWRAAVKALRINVPLSDHMFARPESPD
ncbi:MAG: hypothetical protein OER80_01585 [Gammaproteobacteria bacterium]|nr:hypothetical protein [Gammaproteobacteria bacterium]MDH3767905.1 hypothetical protein [Gammaproteobacteria bacterium]